MSTSPRPSSLAPATAKAAARHADSLRTPRSLARRFGALLGALLLAASPAVAAVVTIDDVLPDDFGYADHHELIELGGGYHVVDYATGTDWGPTYVDPIPLGNGDYLIEDGPLGPGVAHANPDDDTRFELEFEVGVLELVYDPALTSWSIPMGATTLHLLPEADVTVAWDDPYGPEIKARRTVDARTGHDGLQLIFCSGPALFGLDFEVLMTTKSCAYYDFVDDDGNVQSNVPVPAGSSIKGTANGGQPVLVDCSRVYCSSNTLGNPFSNKPNWGGAGGTIGLYHRGGTIPNFADRLATATGEELIFRITLVHEMTVYFFVNDFVVFVVHVTDTQVFEPGPNNAWGFVSGTFEVDGIDTPPDAAVDPADLAATIDFLNGGTNGAPAN